MDSNLVSNIDHACFITKLIFNIKTPSISWLPKKQSILVLSSSTKVEYRALIDVLREILWLIMLLQDLYIHVK